MKRNPEVAAIVVAAGEGRRMRGGTWRSAIARVDGQARVGHGPVRGGAGARLDRKSEKIFAALGGKPLLFYSLKALEVSPEIERVVIVVRKKSVEQCCEFVRLFGFRKVRAIVAGGKRRQDSVKEGLRFVGKSRFVLIHDGARPFLSKRLVSRTVAACKKTGAAIAALPVTDSVKKVSGSTIDATIPRENLWSAQTPQVFRRQVIEEAFQHWPRQSTATDDASLVEKRGMVVTVVEGDLFNIKITFPTDLATAESLLRVNKKPWE